MDQFLSTMRRSQFTAPLLVVGVTLFVYWPMLAHHFIALDDDRNLYANALMYPASAAHIARFWKHSYFDLYVPMTYTVWSWIAMVSYSSTTIPSEIGPIHQLVPYNFHLASLLAHVFNVGLVYSLLMRLFRQGGVRGRREWAAAAGAFLFALHPLQVEAVAWISEFRGLLATFFVLLAVHAYLSFVACGRIDSALGRRWFLCSTIAYLLAVLSKPSAVGAPLIVLAIDYCMLSTASLGTRIAPLTVWISIAAVLVVCTRSAQYVPPYLALPLWKRCFVAGDAVAFYLYKLFFPAHLTLDYAHNPIYVTRHLFGYCTWLAPAVILFRSWAARRRFPAAYCGVLVFYAGLAPVVGLVPFAFQDHSTVADRYAYMPMLGVSMIVCCALNETRRPLWTVIAALVLIGLTVDSSIQLSNWRSGITIFDHSLAVNPHSWWIHWADGLTLEKHGHLVEAGTEYREAIALQPDNAEICNELGLVLVKLGNPNGALAAYRQGIATGQPMVGLHMNIGSILARRGDFAGAANEYRAELVKAQNYPMVHLYLGSALRQSGDFAGAVHELSAALRLMPNIPGGRTQLGLALAESGQRAAASREFVEALRANPEDTQAAAALRALDRDRISDVGHPK